MSTNSVSNEVFHERLRQDQKWGEQNHPDVAPGEIHHEVYVQGAARWKRENDIRDSRDELAWDGILLEEVFEALELGGKDEGALREELIQVAAVAQVWVEAIDRRKEQGNPHSIPSPRAQLEGRAGAPAHP